MALRAFAGGGFFGEVGGSSPYRVLALHGWGRRGSDFTASLRGLDYIALDLPGFGASPAPEEAIGAREYAGIIAPVLEELAPPPVVVGHSFGGRVAVALAACYPGRVGALVLTGVPLLHRERKAPSRRYRFARWAHRHHLFSDQGLERLRQRFGSEDYRAAAGVMRQVLVRVVNESYETELSQLGMPVYLLWGEGDLEVPPGIARQVEAILRQGGNPPRLEVIPGVGHLLPVEAPDALRQAVEATLEWV